MPAIGIDLSTKYACVGVYQNGKVEIIADELGNRAIPSNGFYTDAAAKEQAATSVQSTSFDAEQLAARKYDDSNMQEVINECKNLNISVNSKGENQHLTSSILTKLKSMAEAYLGAEIANATIAVPPDFNEQQREAIKAAAILAGLNVLSLIDVPIAAVLAYGLEKQTQHNVLVCNLGSCALELTVLCIKADASFEVKATASDANLGGEAFDKRLLDHLIAEFQCAYNKDIRANPSALQALSLAAKAAKHNLSADAVANVQVEALMADIDYCTKISRAKFDDLCAALYTKMLGLLQKVLDALEEAEIHDVLLVGDSTRMPKLQNLLQSCCGDQAALNVCINPTEVVVCGASIQAEILSGEMSTAVQRGQVNNASLSNNLVIKACKENNVKALAQLLEEKDITISPLAVDETRHNAFYYAIRSCNVELLDTLINKWPGNYFDLHFKELDELLSSAYEELKLMNVTLSEDLEIFVENMLINLRFYSNANKAEPFVKRVYVKNIKARLEFLLQNISLLNTEYLGLKKVDEKFLFLAKIIAQNIHILKRQLKSSYDSLPWEEIEFCLVSFISTHNKRQEINLFYNATLNKTKILDYLAHFANKLQANMQKMLASSIGKNAELPKLGRQQIIVKVIGESPVFEALYKDYKQIKDIHTLQKISVYIKLALMAEHSEREGQLIIIRVLQVIGEHLKNTLESPNLSGTTSELLLLTLPKSTRQAIIDLRNSLTHAYALDKRIELAENSDAQFFLKVQQEMKKIENVITDILHKNKLKVIGVLLGRIINAESLDELNEAADTLGNLKLAKMSEKNFVLTEHVQLAAIFKELSSKLSNKSFYEQTLFDKIAGILEAMQQKSATTSANYSQTFSLLQSLGISLKDDNMDWNDIKAVKSSCQDVLATLPVQPESDKLKEIAEIARNIYQCFKCRPDVNLDEVQRLIHEIFYLVEFATGDLKWIEELRNKLNVNSTFVPFYKLRKSYTQNAEKYKNQLELKLNELKCTLTHNELADIEKLPFYKTNKNLQAVVEMLVLDIMSILGLTTKHLENNLLYLDDNTPLLCGKSLRNHLAHDNTLVDELLTDPAIAVILNAKKLITENVLESKKKIGKCVKNDAAQLSAKCADRLRMLKKLEDMFLVLVAGDLKGLLEILKSGVDIKAKNIVEQTALHFAAQGHGDVELLKFIIAQKVDAKAKEVNGQTALHVAAACGNANFVEFFVKVAGQHVDVMDNRRRTPMHLAAAKGHKAVVEILLENNADRHAKDLEIYAPVHYAVRSNHIEVAKFMLLKEVNVDSNEASGGFTSLHTAAEKGYMALVDFLLENGANVHAKNEKGAIPLHSAALSGHLAVVQALIAKGADVNSSSNEGCTPLLCAVAYGHKAVTELLLKHGVNVNVIDKTCNKMPLHYAAEKGHVEIVNALLQKKAKSSTVTVESMTPLHLAAQNGHLEAVLALIKHGVNISAKDDSKATALCLAVVRGHKEIVALLLEHGAEVNEIDNNKQTPLHVAALNGRLEICEMLIKHKADVNAEDIKRSTPMHAAAISGSKAILELLLKNKAHIETKTCDGMTSLHFATSKSHEDAVAFLIERKADVNASTDHGLTALHAAIVGGNKGIVKLLLKNKATVDARDFEGCTPLHLAVAAGKRDIVEILLANDANVNMSCQKMTPLIAAVRHNHKKIVEVLLAKGADVNFDNGKPLFLAVIAGYTDIVEILLKHKAQHTKNLEGVTFLHLAAERGHKEIVKILIAKGANVDAKNHNGLTALGLAAAAGHEDVVEVLIANRANVNAMGIRGIPLHEAAVAGHANVVQVLLCNGANVNTKDCDNRTSLEMAVAHGRLEVVKILLEHRRVNLEAKGNDGYTILHIASQENNIQLVKYLVGLGCNIHARNEAGSKPIHLSAREGFLEAVKFFLSKGLKINEFGNCNQTPLHYAVMKGHLEVVAYLLAHGAEVNAADTKGLTPLHIAVLFGFKNVLEVLLSHGAVYNTLYMFRRPVDLSNNITVNRVLELTETYFEAVEQNKCAAVKSCLEAGVCVDARNTARRTPLFYAVENDSADMVEILLQHKANPNVFDQAKLTPLHCAANVSNLKIVKLLLSYGAMYKAVSQTHKIPADLTNNTQIKSLLKLVNDSFKKLRKGNAQLIEDLNNIKDMDVLKAVLNAKDNTQKTLIVAAIQSDYPKLKALKDISQGDVSKLTNEALLLFSQGNYEKAFEKYSSAFEKRKALLGPDSPATLEIQTFMAKMLFKQGRCQVALNMLEEIIEKQVAALGPNDPEILSTKNTIALLLHEQGKNEEALKIYREILQKQKVVLGSKHADTLNTQLHMGLVLDKLGKYDEALCVNRSLYESYKETLGAHDPNTLSAQNNMALVLGNQEKYAEALEIYKAVHEKKKQVLGVNHPDTLRTLCNIADVLRSQEKYPEALKIFREVLSMQSKVLSRNHPAILTTHYCIGTVFFQQGKFISAHQSYKMCCDQMKAVLGPNDPKVIDMLFKINMISSRLQCVGSNEEVLSQDRSEEIIAAVSKGDISAVKHLCQIIADVNVKDAEGRTPLHFAVSNGHIDIVQVLLEHAADVTSVTKKGNTPLHIATSKGNKALVQALLKHVGLDKLDGLVNAKTTTSGSTALHVAAKGGYFEIVKCLLEHGAIYSAENAAGKTAFDLCEGEQEKNLLKSIDYYFHGIKNGIYEAVMKLKQALHSEELEVIFNVRDKQGNTLIQAMEKFTSSKQVSKNA